MIGISHSYGQTLTEYINDKKAYFPVHANSMARMANLMSQDTGPGVLDTIDSSLSTVLNSVSLQLSHKVFT
jgi:hypothetical protein